MGTVVLISVVYINVQVVGHSITHRSIQIGLSLCEPPAMCLPSLAQYPKTTKTDDTRSLPQPMRGASIPYLEKMKAVTHWLIRSTSTVLRSNSSK